MNDEEREKRLQSLIHSEVLHLEQQQKGGIMQQGEPPKGMSIAIGFNWRDIWVGVYISKDHRTVFICPLPMVVIGIRRKG